MSASAKFAKKTSSKKITDFPSISPNLRKRRYPDQYRGAHRKKKNSPNAFEPGLKSTPKEEGWRRQLHPKRENAAQQHAGAMNISKEG